MDLALPYTILFLAVSAIINVGLLVELHRSKVRIARLEADRANPEPQGSEMEAQLRALAQQVDQLASGQEFLNRVVADRLDKLSRPGQSAALPPAITPH